jgi:hypothetical protein
MMISFRFDINLSVIPIVSPRIEIVVEGNFGFYGFVIATIISLIITHIIIHYHRLTREKPM